MKSQGRNTSIDALRAWSILGMLWSGLLPFSVLPPWMYHAQLPPPNHTFDPSLAGLTWVDLVFPFFIFCMGIVVPFAFNRRLESGISPKQLVKQIIQRYVSLLFFAWVIGYAKAFSASATSIISQNQFFYGWDIQAFVLAQFILLWLLFGSIKKLQLKAGLRSGLAILAFAGLLYVGYSSYAFSKIVSMDIIIVILANVYLVGSLLWLISRKSNIKMGLAYGFIFLFYVAIEGVGDAFVWLNELMVFIKPVFEPFMLKYLILFWPAIYIGMLFQSGNVLCTSKSQMNETNKGYILAFLAFLTLGLVTFCIQLRLPFFAIPILVVYFLVLWRFSGGIGNIEWFSMGLLFLGLSLDFFQFEGGIKKDPVTYSYLLTTGGMAVIGLHFFDLLYQYMRRDEDSDWWLLNGQNPLLAYLSVACIAIPILHISGLINVYEMVKQLNGWLGVGITFGLTVLVMYIVSILTRLYGRWRV